MRIVHLVIGGDVAGGQVVALRLARAARGRGDHVVIVSPTEGPFLDRAREEGFSVHLANVNRTFRIGDLIRLARILRRERADVLHTHTAVSGNITSRIAGRLANTRVVTHIHMVNYFHPNPLRAWVLRTLDTTTARLSNRVIAVSEAVRTTLLAQGYRPGRVSVIHNGVEVVQPDPERASQLRAEWGLPDDVPVIGEIGRLCTMKGQHLLISALTQLPDTRLVLVGADIEQGGEYARQLHDLAEEAGTSDRVVFAGFRADAESLIDAFDIVALPSETEGLPLVLLEAMARRKPVVATAVGGIPELVLDGETGLLIAPNDEAQLTHALATLTNDHAYRAALGSAGQARVAASFSAATSTARTLEVYDDLVR